MQKTILTLVIFSLLFSWMPLVQAADSTPLQVAGWVTEKIAPLSVQGTANDPMYSQQWYLRTIKVNQAWDATKGSALTIAVIDTGINASHEELAGRLWANSDEIPGNDRDDDYNGYVDDHNGYNFLANNDDLADQHGHGTGIASIIAANSNNRKGIAGVNWYAKIMVLKALNNIGGGEFGDVARAVRYAVDNGADVINMSFGATTGSAVLASAVDYATSHNVPVIAAAGNDSNNRVFYPARYPQVIAIGSINQNNQRSDFTNYGDGLDLVAIGEDVIMANTGATDAYARSAGSSFAAAQVTGIVSLMLARNSQLTPRQIEDILENTADRLGSADHTASFGAGRVNAQAAVTYQSETLRGSSLISNNQAAADGLDAITLTVTVTNEFDHPRAGTSIRAVISGTNNIINGQLIAFGQPVSLGQTDQNGRISFQFSSTTAEAKQISLVDTANSSTLVGPLTAIFVPVTRPVYSMQWVRQSPYLNMPLQGTATMWVEVRNTGNLVWVSDPDSKSSVGQMRLATAHPNDRTSNFHYANSWLTPNRLTYMTPKIVKPGEVARFDFMIVAKQLGSFREYFGMVVEYASWLNDLGIYWDINVTTSGRVENSDEEQAVDINQHPSAYSAVIQSKTPNLALSPGETALVSVSLRNVGTALWSGNGLGAQSLGEIRLGTAMPQDRVSHVYLPGWISSNRALSAGFNIPPNSNLTLTFTIKAPNVPGVYQENFQLVAEYITWFGPVFGWTITVT